MTDQDIENKFTSLSLAFKTDKLTLTNRLELQQRQRDISEKNIESEISQLKKDIEVNILIFKVNKQLILYYKTKLNLVTRFPLEDENSCHANADMFGFFLDVKKV